MNARGVDLNRNWPTNGWASGPRNSFYPGPKPGSEPETRAMLRFLTRVRPRFVASIHQQLGVIVRTHVRFTTVRAGNGILRATFAHW